jgi:Protein of unknown function (DUF3489)
MGCFSTKSTPGFQREPGINASGIKTIARAARSKSSNKVRSKKQATKKKARPAGKPKRKNKAGSKQDRVLALLRRPDGATLDVLVKATGWQQHSVRGFLAGMVRKKLKLPLRSEKVDGARVYRIGVGKPTKAARADGARSA